MIRFIKKLLKPRYDTLNRIEIDARKIMNNYQLLKERQGSAEIFPVLKSNAYGHGLKEMCEIINKTSAPFVVVDSFPEAQIAWHYFRRKVLIIGEMPLAAYDYCRLRKTEFVVHSPEVLRHLARYGKQAKIHLFVNSGMNREGIKDIGSFIVQNKKYLDRVEVSGFCSHLASADEDSILNQAQEEKFLNDLEILRAHSFFPRWIHLGNSAGVFRLKNQVLTAFRPGLALYGYDPLPESLPEGQRLQPALSVISQVMSVQDIGVGESVSYNESYRAATQTKIAIIPFGYFEGLDRRLSNKAEFIVRGLSDDFYARIAGKVCMNLCCLDAGQHDVHKGDEVIIISNSHEAANSIANLARLIGTIPYEILVRLQSGLRRRIVW